MSKKSRSSSNVAADRADPPGTPTFASPVTRPEGGAWTDGMGAEPAPTLDLTGPGSFAGSDSETTGSRSAAQRAAVFEDEPTTRDVPARTPGRVAPQPSDEPSTGVLGVDVSMTWRGDMHSARFFPRPTRITIGQDGIFPLPPEVMGGKPLHVLVEPDPKHGYVLRVDNAGARGHLIIDGEAHEIAALREGRVPDLGPVVPLGAKTHAWIQFEEFTFVIRRAPVPPPQRAAYWSRENWLLLLCFALAALFLGTPLFVGFQSPEFRNRAKLSYAEEMDERVRELELIEVKVEEEKKPEEKVAEKAEDKKPDEAPQIVPAQVIEKIKAEEKKIKDDLSNLKGEERAEKRAELVRGKVDEATMAIDDALGGGPALPGSRIFAESDDPAGGQAGDGAVVMADPDGKLLAGGGGGGGSGLGKDGVERAQIAGLGKDTGAGGNKVQLGLKERAQNVVQIRSSGGESSGELPKSVIKQFIATKMGAIKACYQKGVQANPDLTGKVKVAFLIQPNGAVLGARIEDTSLNSSSVEECILNHIKNWKFPQAKGGGTTKVLYPFAFSSH